MASILITGGCGYIGSHTLLEFLKNTNHNFLVVDNLSTGFIQNLQYLQNHFPNRITFFDLDLKETQKIEKIFQNHQIECVLHFAASLSVEESTRLPLDYYKNNTINTTHLIELCTKYNVNKFIFSSTAAVYGQPEGDFKAIDENFSLNPINPYGTSKMMSEFVLKDTSKVYDLNYVILRYFNVAGANIDNDFKALGGLGQRSKNATHLIKVALECASGKREKMGIYGTDYDTNDGTCIRDYIHINDLASAHLSAYNYLVNEKKSNIFNVGYSKGYSVQEVIDKVKEVTKQDFLVEILERRAGDPAKLIANNEKILKSTDWKPKYNNLETIIQSAYNFELYLKDAENE